MKLIPFTIRVSQEVKDALEKRRLTNRRRLNDEVTDILENALFPATSPEGQKQS